MLKKILYPQLARPLRGREGGKGRAIKEKRTFVETFFYILLQFKNENYFTLYNLSKYGHITLKFVGRYFYLVVTIFSQKFPKLPCECGECGTVSKLPSKP